MRNAAAAKPTVNTAIIAVTSRQRATSLATRLGKSMMSSAILSCAAMLTHSPVRTSGAAISTSERVHCEHGDRYVVENLGYLGPQRQRRNVLGIERDHDGIAWLDLHVRTSPEPTAALTRDHRAVGAHHVDAGAIGPVSHPPAQRDVVVARQAWVVQVRSRVLHLSDNRDLLLEARHGQGVTIAQNDVADGSGRGTDQARQIDHQSANGFRLLDLTEE